MGFKEYFNFNKMITVGTVKVLHAISIIICATIFVVGVVKGLSILIKSNNTGIYFPFWYARPLIYIFGSLLLYFLIRLILERTILLFKIHEEVSSYKRK